MKKKFINTTIFIVATLFTLTTCLSDNPYRPIVEEDEVASVFIRLTETETEFETRGVGSSTITTLSLRTGDLYLVSNGVIIEHFSIVNDAGAIPGSITNIPATAPTINRSALLGGVRITNVPTNMRGGRVYLVGNTPGNPTSGNINAVLNAPALDIRYQRQQGNTHPHLFGSATLVEVPSSDPETWTAALRLRPAVARLEIHQIVAMGEIYGFTVEGVFIDHYYRRARINGAPYAPSFRDNIDAERPFNNDNLSGYPTAFHTHTFDWHHNTNTPYPYGHRSTRHQIGVPGIAGVNWPVAIARPGTGPGGAFNIWFYYLFPGVDKMPRIVFRLHDVTLHNGTVLPNPQFVVFSRFVWDDVSLVTAIPPGFNDGDDVEYLVAGVRYQIRNNRLIFMEEDLRSTPTIVSTLSTRAIPITIE